MKLEDYNKRIFCKRCLVEDKQVVRVKKETDMMFGTFRLCHVHGIVRQMVSWDFASMYLLKLEGFVDNLRNQLVENM